MSGEKRTENLSDPDRIWVVKNNGELHVITKEPNEGMNGWLKGQQITAAQFVFEKTVYPPDVAKFCHLMECLYK